MTDETATTNAGSSNRQEARRFNTARNPRWVGLFLLAIGAVLLAKQLGVLFPDWLFTWPVILIAVGLFIGIKHNFRNPGWLFPILIGTLFLIDDLTPGLHLKNYIWPIIIIAMGLLFIFRPKTHRHWQNWKHDKWQHPSDTAYGNLPASFDASDFIDSTSIFSGIKKIVLSKNFKGGDITNFMGGTEVNLTQADIQGIVNIDATNIFGGTKLIVPPTWNVISEVVTIFGGVDDKRQLHGAPLDPTKVIRLDGTCIFGGIEIKSF